MSEQEETRNERAYSPLTWVVCLTLSGLLTMLLMYMVVFHP
jgi:hypothetical protein